MQRCEIARACSTAATYVVDQLDARGQRAGSYTGDRGDELVWYTLGGPPCLEKLVDDTRCEAADRAPDGTEVPVVRCDVSASLRPCFHVVEDHTCHQLRIERFLYPPLGNPHGWRVRAPKPMIRLSFYCQRSILIANSVGNRGVGKRK